MNRNPMGWISDSRHLPSRQPDEEATSTGEEERNAVHFSSRPSTINSSSRSGDDGDIPAGQVRERSSPKSTCLRYDPIMS